MVFTQSTHRWLRLVVSIRTGATAIAVVYGYFLGSRAPRQLADALSVGLTVMAVAFAVAFALSASMKHSRALEEMLHRDRAMVRLGVYILKLAVTSTVLSLSYVGLGGAFTQGENLVSALGAVSAGFLSWTLCSMPEMFFSIRRHHCGGGGRAPRLWWSMATVTALSQHNKHGAATVSVGVVRARAPKRSAHRQPALYRKGTSASLRCLAVDGVSAVHTDM